MPMNTTFFTSPHTARACHTCVGQKFGICPSFFFYFLSPTVASLTWPIRNFCIAV
jgi:hypothetical protein